MNEKKKEEKKGISFISREKAEEEEGREGGEERGGRTTQTHHTVDCHDFAEDDTVCRWGRDFLAGCVSRKEQRWFMQT